MRKDLVTFRDNSMQPPAVARATRVERATGDDEKEEKRMKKVEHGRRMRKRKSDGHGDGKRMERERTRANGG